MRNGNALSMAHGLLWGKGRMVILHGTSVLRRRSWGKDEGLAARKGEFDGRFDTFATAPSGKLTQIDELPIAPSRKDRRA